MSERSDTTSALAADAAARAKALVTFDKPVVMIAGAGTGKTTALIRRIVVWSLGRGWKMHEAAGDTAAIAARVLQRITCMTFTEKAAGEMSRKFAECLQQVQREPQSKHCEWLMQDARVRAEVDMSAVPNRAAALAAQAHLLRASTIHAFCQRLLREHAVQAELPPAFEVDATGTRSAAIVGRLFFDELPRLTAAPNQAAAVLWRLGTSPADVLEALQTLVNASVRAADLRVMRCTEEDVRAEFCELLPDLEALVQCLPAKHKRYDRREPAQLVIDQVTSMRTGMTGHVFIAGLTQLEGSLKILKTIATNTLSAEAEALPAEADQAALRESASRLHKRLRNACALGADTEKLTALRTVLADLLQNVEVRLRAEGCLRFDDLLHQTSRLLSKQPAVARQVAEEMDQLLLDEVQDTDPCQYSIVRSLLEQAPSGLGLFIIGDPKQCIYTFRNADLGALGDFETWLRERGATTLELSRNFRSQHPILDEVAALMRHNMHEVIGQQPPFAKLHAKDDATDSFEDAAPIEYWDVSAAAGQKESARQEREREAAAIAVDIVRQRTADVQAGAAPTKYSEFMILLRSLPDQGLYLKALRDADIPVVCEKERDWHRRREVVDACSALLCVFDPTDEVALLGFLRSPLVGLPDAGVEAFWKSAVRQQLCKGVTEIAEGDIKTAVDAAFGSAAVALRATASGAKACAALGDWRCSLERALQDILLLRSTLASASVDKFLAAFRARILCEVIEASRDLGGIRMAAVGELLTQVARDLRRGTALLALAESLREQLRGDIGRESETPSDPEEDAVRLMTVHKAKGLEADFVYFVDLSRNPAQNSGLAPNAVYRWRGPSEAAVAPSGNQKFAFKLLGVQDLDNADASAEAKQREAYELVRLLYVAATRARKRLVLSAAWRHAWTDKGASANTAGKTLGLLQERWGRERFEALHKQLLRATQEAGAATPVIAEPGVWARGIAAQPLVRKQRSAATELAREIMVAQPVESVSTIAAQRPLTLAMSSLGKHESQALRVAAQGDEDEHEAQDETNRVHAMQHGTHMHKAMELWDTSAPKEAEVERVLTCLKAMGTVAELTEKAIRECPKSAIFARFAAIKERILAREFPMLQQNSARAVMALIGTIDMLYEDEAGQVVVVDYKTDKCDEAELLARHTAQMQAYVTALSEALPGRKVRCELWWFETDCFVNVPSQAPHPTSD